MGFIDGAVKGFIKGMQEEDANIVSVAWKTAKGGAEGFTTGFITDKLKSKFEGDNNNNDNHNNNNDANA